MADSISVAEVVKAVARETLLVHDTVLAVVHDTVRVVKESGSKPDPWSMLSIGQSLFGGVVGALVASWDSRARRHHSGLVKLEWRFNRALNRISDNLLQVNGLIKSSELGAVHWSQPDKLEGDATSQDDLVNLELKNELMAYETLVEKLNHDSANVSSAYGQMSAGLMSGVVTLSNFQSEARKMIEKLRILQKAYEHLDEETKRLLSCVRVMAKRELPLSGRIVLLLTRSRMPSANELAQERAKLDKEIAATKAASGEEIKRITGATPT